MQPRTIVIGIREEHAADVPGDLLAEWDIVFHPATAAGATHGDVVARRAFRRSRFSMASVLGGDSHPVILIARDVPFVNACDVWRRVMLSVERGGTLSDVLMESDAADR
ncbi:hypothetical protein [Gordonia soli]|uniref:hypothetical protein n=1 Tax=Gordonia soli TaxID=320799 RepID=UPI000349498E|nr:hypothetical protein [Gordonia soli]